MNSSDSEGSTSAASTGLASKDHLRQPMEIEPGCNEGMLDRAIHKTQDAYHHVQAKTKLELQTADQTLKQVKGASVAGIDLQLKKLKRFIGNKHEAAKHGFAVDNEYIHTGYRINHNSSSRAFKSIVSCHNETVNVWSHLCGSFFYVLVLAALYLVVAPMQMQTSLLLEMQYKLTFLNRTNCTQTMFVDQSDLSCFLAGKIRQFELNVESVQTASELAKLSN